jgi:hypothetical protein
MGPGAAQAALLVGHTSLAAVESTVSPEAVERPNRRRHKDRTLAAGQRPPVRTWEVAVQSALDRCRV